MQTDMGAVLRTTDRGSVRIISFARPPMNAIDLPLVIALGESVNDATESASCRAVLITGDPPAFSAGIDVKVVPRYDSATRAEMIRRINRCILQFYGLRKPTVAAINGHALGAGLVIALACDFRLAAEGSYRLGLTEITAGIPFPAAPMIVVQSELDSNTARTLTLSGCTFGPADPLAGKFIDGIVPADRLLEAAVERATEAAQLTAYGAVKRQLKEAALGQIERVVEQDADPLLGGWF